MFYYLYILVPGISPILPSLVHGHATTLYRVTVITKRKKKKEKTKDDFVTTLSARSHMDHIDSSHVLTSQERKHEDDLVNILSAGSHMDRIDSSHAITSQERKHTDDLVNIISAGSHMDHIDSSHFITSHSGMVVLPTHRLQNPVKALPHVPFQRWQPPTGQLLKFSSFLSPALNPDHHSSVYH